MAAYESSSKNEQMCVSPVGMGGRGRLGTRKASPRDIEIAVPGDRITIPLMAKQQVATGSWRERVPPRCFVHRF